MLSSNAKQIFSGSAKVRALRGVWIKSKYLSSLFEVADKVSLDLNKTRILDVGCSKCEALLALQKMGLNNLTGLNQFAFDLQWLSSDQNYGQHFGNQSGKIKYIVCDVDTERFPFEDSSHEIILLMDVLDHLHDPERVLLECHRVLAPGGLIVISSSNVANLKNRIFALFGRSIYPPLDEWLGTSQRISNGGFRRFLGHVREYTMEEIDFMMRKYGFQVLIKKYHISHLRRMSILYQLYALLERLYPKLAYYMLIVCRRPLNE